MSAGYIKLHKKILRHPKYRDANWFRLFTFLLLSAAYEPVSATHTVGRWNGGQTHSIPLEAGELVGTIRGLSTATGLTEKAVRYQLQKMVIDNEILIKFYVTRWYNSEIPHKGTHTGSEEGAENNGRKIQIIKVLNWEAYQQGHASEIETRGVSEDLGHNPVYKGRNKNKEVFAENARGFSEEETQGEKPKTETTEKPVSEKKRASKKSAGVVADPEELVSGLWPFFEAEIAFWPKLKESPNLAGAYRDWLLYRCAMGGSRRYAAPTPRMITRDVQNMAKVGDPAVCEMWLDDARNRNWTGWFFDEAFARHQSKPRPSAVQGTLAFGNGPRAEDAAADSAAKHYVPGAEIYDDLDATLAAIPK